MKRRFFAIVSALAVLATAFPAMAQVSSADVTRLADALNLRAKDRRTFLNVVENYAAGSFTSTAAIDITSADGKAVTIGSNDGKGGIVLGLTSGGSTDATSVKGTLAVTGAQTLTGATTCKAALVAETTLAVTGAVAIDGGATVANGKTLTFEDGKGLVSGATVIAATGDELNANAVGNRVTSATRRVLIGTQRFTVLDAVSTTVYIGGLGAASQVDAISVCASGTLPIDAGGVTLAVQRVSDSKSVLVGATVDLTVAVQTADQCTAPALSATATDLDLAATDQLKAVIATDEGVDTNGTEFIVSAWGSLD